MYNLKEYQKTKQLLLFNEEFPVGKIVSVRLPDDSYVLSKIVAPAHIMTDGVIRCRIAGKDGYLRIDNVQSTAEPVQIPNE